MIVQNDGFLQKLLFYVWQAKKIFCFGWPSSSHEILSYLSINRIESRAEGKIELFCAFEGRENAKRPPFACYGSMIFFLIF